MAGRYPNGDFYGFEKDLPDAELKILHTVREWAQQEVKPHAAEYWNKWEFPSHLLPAIGKLDIISLVRHQGRSRLLAGLVTADLHRADGSVGTFFSGHDGLFTGSIELLGSDEQRDRFLPDCYAVKKFGVLAITEPEAGSDVARGMRTTARKVDGGWVLNGHKTWIGNATISDYAIIYARDEDDDQVKGFLVETGWEGYRAELMTGRIAIRAVQNADIYLDNLFVPDDYKLANANTFKDLNRVFKAARAVVGWQAVGLQMAALDAAVAYADSREQFGRKLGSFQLIQSKLATMQANLIASESMLVALGRLQDRGEDHNEHASLAKAQATRLARETVALGRELMGGNGMLTDHHMAKIFCDAEALYTYEGTYDINQLIVGRSLTGESAFV